MVGIDQKLSNVNTTVLGFIYSTIFGLNFMFTKLLLDSVNDEYHLVAFRFIFAFLFFYISIRLKIIKVEFKEKPIRKLALINILAIIQSTLMAKSLKYLPSSQAGIIVALSPIIVTILSILIMGERPSKKSIFFIILSFGGIIIININAFNESSSMIKGILLMLFAVLLSSLYTIQTRKLFKDYTPVEICYSTIITGTIFFNLVSICKHIRRGIINSYLLPISNLKSLLGFTYIGAIANGLGFLLSVFVLSRVTPSKAAVFANLVTVISIFAGVMFLKESFQLNQIIGSIMILIGVYFTQKY